MGIIRPEAAHARPLAVRALIGAARCPPLLPADNPVGPADFVATILFALGINPQAELRDKLDRPVAACTGKPLEQLFS